MIFDRLAKKRLAFPFRKLGLIAARYWPFPVRARTSTGQVLWVDLRSSIGRAILVKGEFDQEVWRTLNRLLRPGSVFVDVGANVGYYSVLAAERVGVKGRVEAFEIDPRPLRCLRKNAAACLQGNICINEFAISDYVGDGVLDARVDCGHSRLQRDGDGALVRVVTLDQWMADQDQLLRVDVIKLDIEGGEIYALQGASNTIKKYQPIIVCEALESRSPGKSAAREQLLSCFAEMGYSTSYVSNVHSPTIVALPTKKYD